MEEEAFINDVEQQHRNLSQEMQNVVDLYKGAIVSMQEEKMSGGAGKHTIILVQYSNSFQSRSYMEFPAVNAALDALVKMYEHKLKELNPSVPNITYDISDLYQYLDSLHDLCGLVLDPSSNKYEPKDRKWLKEKIFAHLRGQAK